MDYLAALFFLPYWDDLRANAIDHGICRSSISKYDISSIVIFSPFLEEMVFRAPVLWFSAHGKMAIALAVIIAGGTLFGFAHWSAPIQYADGFTEARPWALILNAVVGGLMYGLMVMVTASLWPVIFLHAFYNLSALLVDPAPFVRAARAMQR